MFGQGDWMRAGSPFTNGELLSKAQNYVREITSLVDKAINKANAESRYVKWSADYSNWLKSKENFKDGQIATTDLSTKSDAVMNENGTVARFNVNLHIDINWNESQSRTSELRYARIRSGSVKPAKSSMRGMPSKR
jgi:hypothetical protein